MSGAGLHSAAPDPDLAHCADRLRRESPDLWRAALWSPARARPGLIALFALDRELEAVVETTTEPRIGQIRLAWWRERLDALDGPAPPPAQPTLRALAAFAIPALSGAALAACEDDFLTWIEGVLPEAAWERGTWLFRLAALLLGVDEGGVPLDRAGVAWAAGALRRRGLDVPATVPPARLRRPLRPFLALARLGSRNPAEPAHAPGRQLVFARTMLFG